MPSGVPTFLVTGSRQPLLTDGELRTRGGRCQVATDGLEEWLGASRGIAWPRPAPPSTIPPSPPIDEESAVAFPKRKTSRSNTRHRWVGVR